MAKKMTKIERKEARLRKGKQWLLTYTGSPKKDEQALPGTLSCG